MFRRTLLRTLHPAPRTCRSFSTRSFLRQEHPQQPQYQAPGTEQPAAPRPNPHREVYKSSGPGRAIAYNFLIAMVTFQVLYWGWLKLESVEVKQEKMDEMRKLEVELGSLATKKGGN